MSRQSAPLITLFLLLGTASLAQSPALVNQTLIDGYYIPHASRLEVGADGSAYVLGSAYEDQHSLDVILNKVGPDGGHVWELYINGGNHDYAEDIQLDADGNIWVCGWTDSPDFPLVDPLDADFVHREAFLMKVDAQDGSLLYSTFLGGDYTDRATAMALGQDGSIYLAGETGSTDFPVTADALQPEPSFPMYFFTDAFVARISPAGDQLLYATYFGGTEDDYAQGLALDAADNILLAGHTTAEDFPLVDAIDEYPKEMFLAKLSADGQSQLFGSYFGGAYDLSTLRAMEADAAGNIYLAGFTRAPDFPTTPGTWSPDFIGAINGCYEYFYGYYNCDDFFVCKVSTSGEGVLWGTFLGGTAVDQAKDMALDDQGNVYLAGYSASLDFPGNDSGVGSQIAVAKLSGDGADLEFTYLQNSGSANRGNGVAVGPDGGVYFSGTIGVPASIMVCKLEQRSSLSGAGDLPAGFALAANYPNPFNPSTTITYRLPQDGEQHPVRLDVFDVQGRLVRRLVDDRQDGGTHSVVWDGRGRRGGTLSSGVYYYRLQSDGLQTTRSMTLLK